MKIIQLLPSLHYGDAVGNDTVAIKRIIKEMGYETQIYAMSVDERLPKGTAEVIPQMPKFDDEDIIIYHAATGTELNYLLPEYRGRKVVMYHNITPPEFFRPYSHSAAMTVKKGLFGVRYLADKVDYCIADSDFNKEDLLRMGFICPIDVCPILIPFSDYEKEPSEKILKKYQNDGYTNLLFVGRIAPNKKQEDVIRAFYQYKQKYNDKSRLILAGSWRGMETYYERLQKYVDLLGLKDSVVFTGHIKFDELLAYYRIADAFLCMSEHEGFCVPLVESMYFDIPIIAFDCAAIPYTLGGSGLLLDSKEPEYVAAVIDRVITDEDLQTFVLEKQRNRLEEFQYEVVKKMICQSIERVILHKM